MAQNSGDAPQRVRIGNYVVRRRLGRGGMGEVYLAHDEALDRPVAIKVLKAQYANDPDFVRRFQREARAAARLNHPNIVQVHAVHIDAAPPYMVMEYVDGVSLEQQISSGNRVPWAHALLLSRQVASALGVAHAQGIIHRDIKPGNIIVDKQGRVRVTDFGIAKVLNQETRLTAEQTSVGSPCYMSPEQCGVGDIGPHSDLFALGITLYELMTGELPFKAETNLGLIHKITSEPLPNITEPFPEIPAQVQAFIETLTAKDPQYRYAQAREVVEDVTSMQAGRAPEHLSRLRAAAKKSGAVPLIPDNWTTQVGIPVTAEDLMAEDKPKSSSKPPQTTHAPRPLWPLAVGGAVLVIAVAVGAILGLAGTDPVDGPPSVEAATPDPDDAVGQPASASDGASTAPQSTTPGTSPPPPQEAPPPPAQAPQPPPDQPLHYQQPDGQYAPPPGGYGPPPHPPGPHGGRGGFPPPHRGGQHPQGVQPGQPGFGPPHPPPHHRPGGPPPPRSQQPPPRPAS